MSDKSYQLVVRKGPKPGQVFSLSSSTISIGRDPMSDITLSDPEVSRYHAQMVETEAGYQIQDMGSTNGTYVDGERLGSSPLHLDAGKKILLGSSVVLEYQEVAEGDNLIETKLDSDNEPEPDWVDEYEDSTDLSEQEELLPLPDDYYEPPVSPAQTFRSLSKSPPESPPPPPPVAMAEGDGGTKRRRNITIAVVILLALCCGCIIFLYTGYFYWGDPLLDFLIEIGLFN